MGITAYVKEEKKELTKEVRKLTHSWVRLVDSSEGGLIVQNGDESSFVAEVKEKQDQDPMLLQFKEDVHKQKMMTFAKEGDGVVRYQGRLFVPNVDELRDRSW